MKSAAKIRKKSLNAKHSGIILFLLQIAPDGEFLVGQWGLEEEAGQIAHDEDDEVGVNAKHIFMVGEVPVAQVEQGLLHSVAINVDFSAGQHSVSRKDDCGGNADVQALFVGTATKQPKNKDADNSCREDGVE